MINDAAHALIAKWLQGRLPAEQWDWLQGQLKAVAHSNSDRELHISLGMAPRKLGKADLQLTPQELVDANMAIHGWRPTHWSVDGAARLLILHTLSKKDEIGFADALKALCATADVSEAVVYYQGMALYPYSPKLDEQMGEGLRTNMRAVFEAIAHNNPYPEQHFDVHRWNHMILKALFVDSHLYPIQGLDRRANSELAEILCHYAHERWAASRPVTPELWRCVGPHADNTTLKDLIRASQSDNRLEHQGAMLALSQCPLPQAAAHMENFAQTAKAISNADLTWDTLSSKL